MIKTFDSVFSIDKQAWNSCVPDNHPFLKYEFYEALELSKCIGKAIGWYPQFLCLFKENQLVAILPTYIKTHSYGEFIFDWSWAQAYERHGLDYYPKLLSALPHTPVSAVKIISNMNITIHDFSKEIAVIEQKHRTSSSHFLFTNDTEAQALESHKYVQRHSIQFHWYNKHYTCFDDFLCTLRKNKRKNVKKERQSIIDTGLEIIEKTGTDLTNHDADYLTDVYYTTISKKWSQAYLNREFFTNWLKLQADQIILIMAYRESKPIAAAIHLKSDTRLFGRYWGCTEEVPFLHFELCYYRAMEIAIREKLEVVEAGAQGEQKLLRGFEPVTILSHHRINHPDFALAINKFIAIESKQLLEVKKDYEKLLPFKRTSDQ